MIIHTTKLYFSYIFGLHSRFLAHSPWNFLNKRAMGVSLVIIFDVQSLIPRKYFRAIKVKWVFCYE